MAGHSHFANIKHKKERADAARGKLFSRLSKIITICARDRGGDIAINSQLRLAVEKAKAANMPKDNIEKAIKKGIGEVSAEKIETITFEILGPENTSFIVETITDNKNRTTSEIKAITNKNGFKFAGEGSVKWMFGQSGIIEVEGIADDKKEELEMIVVEAEAEDLIWYKNEEGLNNVNIYTKIEDLEKVKNKIRATATTTLTKLKIKDSKVGWKAKELIEIKEENVKKITRFLEELNENNDVQEIYFNFI